MRFFILPNFDVVMSCSCSGHRPVVVVVRELSGEQLPQELLIFHML